MIAANLISSARIKDIKSFLESREPSFHSKQRENAVVVQLNRDEPKPQKDLFHGWCMPDAPTGYIKPKKSDLL